MFRARWVRTGSGFIAVQVGHVVRSKWIIDEHFGTARNDEELALLWQQATDYINNLQPTLDILSDSRSEPPRGLFDATEALNQELLPISTSVRPGGATKKAGDTSSEENGDSSGGRIVTTGSASELLYSVLRKAYAQLGFHQVGDEVFEQVILARIVEPTSKADTPRVLSDLGQHSPSRVTIMRHLKRAIDQDCRDTIAKKCVEHVSHHGDISLTLYDVTTLYFETDKEDDLRKVGFSKERRVDPQIIVGLLTDRKGFPLDIACWEGNKSEKRTIVPVVEQFKERHNAADMVVVADAGMLSAENLTALDEAHFKFIVGSKTSKAPHDLASHLTWHGDAFTDGQTIDTVTPRRRRPTTPDAIAAVNDPVIKAEPVWGDGDHSTWRAVWQYRAKRAAKDTSNLAKQYNRAQAVLAGEKATRAPRFVTAGKKGMTFNQRAYDAATKNVGLKGYVTNTPVNTMPAKEVVACYHELWHVEQAFRMAKSDLEARPIFHRKRDSIEAHLTVVFTALAVVKHLEAVTGETRRTIVNTLRPLRTVTLEIGAKHVKCPPKIPTKAQEIINTFGE